MTMTTTIMMVVLDTEWESTYGSIASACTKDEWTNPKKYEAWLQMKMATVTKKRTNMLS